MKSDLAMAKNGHLQEMNRLQQDMELLREDLDLTKKDLSESQSHVMEYKNTINVLNDELDRVRRIHDDASMEVSGIRLQEGFFFFFLI